MKIVIIINKDDTITRISTIKIRKIKSEVTIILLVSLWLVRIRASWSDGRIFIIRFRSFAKFVSSLSLLCHRMFLSSPERSCLSFSLFSFCKTMSCEDLEGLYRRNLSAFRRGLSPSSGSCLLSAWILCKELTPWYRNESCLYIRRNT